jgi:hypothetical protein
VSVGWKCSSNFKSWQQPIHSRERPIKLTTLLCWTGCMNLLVSWYFAQNWKNSNMWIYVKMMLPITENMLLSKLKMATSCKTVSWLNVLHWRIVDSNLFVWLIASCSPNKHYRKHLNFRGPKAHENKLKPTKIAAENKFDENNQLFSSAFPKPTKIVGRLTIYVGLGGRRK